MDRAGALEWVAIALAFVAVLVILRYGSRPRCELCRRRHHRRPVEAIPVRVALVSPEPNGNGHADVDLELGLEIDLTTSWQPNGHHHEPAGLELVAISWRADQHAGATAPGADVEAPA